MSASSEKSSSAQDPSQISPSNLNPHMWGQDFPQNPGFFENKIFVIFINQAVLI